MPEMSTPTAHLKSPLISSITTEVVLTAAFQVGLRRARHRTEEDALWSFVYADIARQLGGPLRAPTVSVN